MEGLPVKGLSHGLQGSEAGTVPREPPTETRKNPNAEQDHGLAKSSGPLNVWAKTYTERVTQD